MTIDERLEALTMNLELLSHEFEAYRQLTNGRIDKILAISESNAAHIDKILIISENLVEVSRNHERRIGGLEA